MGGFPLHSSQCIFCEGCRTWAHNPLWICTQNHDTTALIFRKTEKRQKYTKLIRNQDLVQGLQITTICVKDSTYHCLKNSKRLISIKIYIRYVKRFAKCYSIFIQSKNSVSWVIFSLSTPWCQEAWRRSRHLYFISQVRDHWYFEIRMKTAIRL